MSFPAIAVRCEKRVLSQWVFDDAVRRGESCGLRTVGGGKGRPMQRPILCCADFPAILNSCSQRKAGRATGHR